MTGPGSSAKAEGNSERGSNDPRSVPSREVICSIAPGKCSPDERSDIRVRKIKSRGPGYRCAHPGYGLMRLIQSASSCHGWTDHAPAAAPDGEASTKISGKPSDGGCRPSATTLVGFP
jgi:hypothetical protein